MKKVLAILMCLYWMGLMLQPVVAQILPSRGMHKSCCATKKMHKSGGCHDDKEKSDCCPKGKCNPLFSQCPMCAYVAIPPAAGFGIGQKVLFTDEVQYGITPQAPLSSYHSNLFRPPIVSMV